MERNEGYGDGASQELFGPWSRGVENRHVRLIDVRDVCGANGRDSGLEVGRMDCSGPRVHPTECAESRLGISYNVLNKDFTVILRNEKGQRVSRQTTLPLRYPVDTQRLTDTNQADPHRPMPEHERLDVAQQFPQLLESNLRDLIHVR